MRKAIVALFIAGVLLSVGASVVDAQTFYQRFENVWAKSLTTTGNSTIGGNESVVGNAAVGGTLATTGASTAASYTASGRVQAGTLLGTTVVATQTVVADGTVTATGTFQPITAAGGVGTSNVTVLPNGVIVTFVNVGSNTITFTDTGTLILAGNAALGAGDSVTLQSNGVNMYQIAASNN